MDKVVLIGVSLIIRALDIAFQDIVFDRKVFFGQELQMFMYKVTVITPFCDPLIYGYQLKTRNISSSTYAEVR